MITHCPNGQPLVFVNEGLGYCRHIGRGFVLFYTTFEPPVPAFSIYAGKPSLEPLWVVGQADDEPGAIALEAAEVQRVLVTGGRQ